MAVYTRNGSTLARRADNGFVPLWQAMDRLLQDGQWLNAPFAGFRTAFGAAGTNLWETAEGYVVQVALPGMKTDSIVATVEQDVLTVSAEPGLATPENAKAIWQSLGGKAEFRIQLPAEVESGEAEATYEAGVLTVRLPKAAHNRPRTIKVVAN